jgi:hypothetical protein
MPKNVEYRWAILAKSGSETFLAGKYCWIGTHLDRPEASTIPTFRTREEARMYARDLTSFRRGAKPVKVAVTTATIKKDDTK